MKIVGREKNIEAEVYNAFYGGQWMKKYPFSIKIIVLCFGTLFDVFSLDMVIEFSLQTFMTPVVRHSWGRSIDGVCGFSYEVGQDTQGHKVVTFENVKVCCKA